MRRWFGARQMNHPGFGLGGDDGLFGRMGQVFQGRFDPHFQRSVNAFIDGVTTRSHCAGNLADGLAGLITEKDFGPDHLAEGLGSGLGNRLDRLEIIESDQQNRALGFSGHAVIEAVYPHSVDILMKRCTSARLPAVNSGRSVFLSRSGSIRG